MSKISGSMQHWQELPDFNKGPGASMSEGQTELGKYIMYVFSIYSSQ